MYRNEKGIMDNLSSTYGRGNISYHLKEIGKLAGPPKNCLSKR